MSTIKTFVKNSFMILLSTVTDRLLSFIFFVSVARYLGSADFGRYSFVFAFITFFIVFSAFGMDGLVIREVAKDKTLADKYLTNISILKIIFLIVSWVIIGFLIFFMHKDAKTNLGIIIISFGLMPDLIVKTIKAIFSGYEKMEYNTLIEIVFRLLMVGLGFCAIFLDYGFVAIFIASMISSFLTLIFALLLYRKHFLHIKFEFNPELYIPFLRTCFPFLLSGLFISIYQRIDVIMLSNMKGDAAVGWYSAARGLTEGLIFIPGTIYMAVYPVFSRLHKDCHESFITAFEKLFKVLLILALPLAIGTTILAGKIILLLFKAQFVNSIFALRILIWAMAIAFLNIIMTPALYSANKQKAVAIMVSVISLLNILINYPLILKYSHIGASITTVITELITFIWLYHLMRIHIFRIDLIKVSLKPALASLIMGIIVFKLYDINIFLNVLIGAAVYLLILILLKTFDKTDIALFGNLLPVRIKEKLES